MNENDYKEMKNKTEELIESISEINKEATSFAKTKEELLAIAESLRFICNDISKMITASDTILEQVYKVSVSGTLEELRHAAESFDESSKALFKKFEASALELQNNVAKESRQNLEAFLRTSEEQMQLLHKKTLNRIYLVCGILIVCVVLTLIITIIK